MRQRMEECEKQIGPRPQSRKPSPEERNGTSGEEEGGEKNRPSLNGWGMSVGGGRELHDKMSKLG